MKYSELLASVLPDRCPVCMKIMPFGQKICKDCKDTFIPTEKPICRLCGRYIFDCRCKSCVTPEYKAVVAPFVHKGGAKQAIANLKFGANGSAVSFLAHSMAEEVRKQYGGKSFDAVVPVPLFKTCRRERGFNQSELLARVMADDLGLPLDCKAIKKIKLTKKQHELGASERRTNLKGAFTCEKILTSKNILLTDDIITTGATLSECAKELYKAGAASVYAVVAAVAV